MYCTEYVMMDFLIQHYFADGSAQDGQSQSIWLTIMLRPLAKPCNIFARSARRGYAVQAPGAPRLQVFDRRAKWMQKERAAGDSDTSRRVDYLRDEVAARLCERLLVCYCFLKYWNKL